MHRKIDVPPLREGVWREVVSRPAELLSARFETAGFADTRRTAEDSVKDVGVAHEAVFRRWQKLRDWIGAEREFVAWRTGSKPRVARGRRRRIARTPTPCLWGSRSPRLNAG